MNIWARPLLSCGRVYIVSFCVHLTQPSSCVISFSPFRLTTRVRSRRPGAFEGHYYEFWRVREVDWGTALKIASESQYNGVNGHLITISSKAEQDFIACLCPVM